jgi:hypothetical protein
VPVAFLERYVLAVFAAFTVVLAITNPMGFDATQRITGCIALVFAAYFTGYTIGKGKAPSDTPTSSSESALVSAATSAAIPKPPPGFGTEDRNHLVTALKAHVDGGGPFTVHIDFANVKHQQRAKQLASCFELAGWSVQVNNVAMESWPNFGHVIGYRTGVSVKSANIHLA